MTTQTRGLPYILSFDDTAWLPSWECTHPGCGERGAAHTRLEALVLAQAHADIHAVADRRGW